VPPRDYISLLALLRRQLTDDEVVEVARTILGEDSPDIEQRVDNAIRAITRKSRSRTTLLG
jgi:hypothetical protein